MKHIIFIFSKLQTSCLIKDCYQIHSHVISFFFQYSVSLELSSHVYYIKYSFKALFARLKQESGIPSAFLRVCRGPRT